jgi:hypothetical protein
MSNLALLLMMNASIAMPRGIGKETARNTSASGIIL